MRTIAVLQNTDSEHLGLVEDHLEGRNIRFRYVRPAHDSDWVRKAEMPKDGLILLGAAPYGTVSEPKMPLIDHKLRITEACLRKNLPILAFGTGAQLLCLALGGKVEQSELRLSVDSAYRTFDEALKRISATAVSRRQLHARHTGRPTRRGGSVRIRRRQTSIVSSA